MLVNYHADTSTPERKRSLIRSIRGIPWWGVLIAYLAALVLGMLLSLFTKELGIPFAVVFILCSTACAVFADCDALFTATVMPVLGYAIAYIVFYSISMLASGDKGGRAAIIKIGLPFISDVPIMLGALCVAAVIVITRIVITGIQRGWDSLKIVAFFTKKKDKKHSAETTKSESAKKKHSRSTSSSSSSSLAQPTTAANSVASSQTPATALVHEHRTTTPRPRPIAHNHDVTLPRIAHSHGNDPRMHHQQPRTEAIDRTSDAEMRRRAILAAEERQRKAVIIAAKRQGIDPRDPRVKREIARRIAAVRRRAANDASAPRHPVAGMPTTGSPYPRNGAPQPYPSSSPRTQRHTPQPHRDSRRNNPQRNNSQYNTHQYSDPRRDPYSRSSHNRPGHDYPTREHHSTREHQMKTHRHYDGQYPQNNGGRGHTSR